MPTSRPFAYNTGIGITGTTQIGSIAVGVDQYLPYATNYGGVQWWAGVDEDLGYAICRPVVSGNQPNPLSIPCYVGFDQSVGLTNQSFVNLANSVFPGNNFTTATGASSWLASNGYWTSYNGPALDPDAEAFIVAAAITNITQQSAINTLVVGLKADSLWTKMSAIYPFVGGTATTHKFNLKDPRDLDAAYRIQFFGGWTHNSNGITGNGTNGYANTFVQINTAAMPDRLNHWGVYNRIMPTPFSGMRYISGILDFNAPNKMLGYGAEPGNAIAGLQNFQSTGFGINPGFFNGTVTSNTTAAFYRNGVLSYTPSGSPNTMVTQSNFYIGAMNVVGSSPFDYNNTNFAFWSFGGALTATDASNFYTRVQAFQTTLGRQV